MIDGGYKPARYVGDVYECGKWSALIVFYNGVFADLPKKAERFQVVQFSKQFSKKGSGLVNWSIDDVQKHNLNIGDKFELHYKIYQNSNKNLRLESEVRKI